MKQAVLTLREKAILTGRCSGTREERDVAIKKLVEFQKTKVDPAYVKARNKLAKKAYNYASNRKGNTDKIYHRKVKELAIQAGIMR